MVVKEQVASFFEVTGRTIDNYIEKYGDELRQNGYAVLRGNRLKSFKKAVSEQDVNEIGFVNIKTPQLGVFDFRAFLNLAMLIIESERARLSWGQYRRWVFSLRKARKGPGQSLF